MQTKHIKKYDVLGFTLNSTNLSTSVSLPTSSAKGDEANKLGKNFRYHTFNFKFTVDGTLATVAQMEKLINIKVEISTPRGDEVLREFSTAGELYKFNKARGHKIKTGYADIHFTDWTAKTDVEQGITALGTADISKLVVSAKLTKGHGLTSPEVTLTTLEDSLYEDIGIYEVVKKSIVNFSTVGKHKITHNDEDLLGEGLLNSLTVFQKDFTDCYLELDKVKMQDIDFNQATYLNQVMNITSPKRLAITTADGIFHKDFAGNTPFGGVVMAGRECKIEFTTTASINANIYYVFLKGVDTARANMMNALGR